MRMKFSKILVPLDGSILAEAALWTAVEIADGGTISLLRVAEAPTLPGVNSPKAQVAAVRKAQEYLRRVIKRLNSKGMSNVEANVWCGPPPAAIVEAAQRQKVDLIVMSTHGRSGLGRLVLGSVTESVLRGSTAPILIVRPDGAPVDAPVGGVGPAGPSFRV
jgi:nucleotide-binding universal stress UspA family protein